MVLLGPDGGFRLGVCQDLHLDVSRRFRYYLTKVGNLMVWNVHKFDRELTLMISGLICGSGNWNSFIMSFGTYVQNLRSFRVDLIWFCTSFGS